eukprot:CAMPEP_0115233948 /NCGR_PEP_ID=MMETSP0270-20121206/34540_1 /TAXON_ID=71861 /ORGANISM="Scrippsiella trochoidea, Strain CCMP3099" /LENGTH=129 /DNA_ID=CAMNT_0002648679 /DNA_START=648 /DNA_END=1038 /DNA_ORIENTATION=+
MSRHLWSKSRGNADEPTGNPAVWTLLDTPKSTGDAIVAPACVWPAAALAKCTFGRQQPGIPMAYRRGPAERRHRVRTSWAPSPWAGKAGAPSTSRAPRKSPPLPLCTSQAEYAIAMSTSERRAVWSSVD